MPGKILGLDIREDYIAAVQVMSGLKGYQVTSCFQVKCEEGKGVNEALRELSQEIDVRGENCFASIPGIDISYRNIQMPFKEQKKISQTLPFEIEAIAPFPIEEMIIDFNIIDSSEKSEILAVSAKKAYISKYLDDLKAYGIEPDLIDICPVPTALWLLNQEDTPKNGLFLDIGLNWNNMILFLNGRIVLIRDFASNGGTITSSVSETDDKNSQKDSLSAQEIESRLRVFCESVQKTVHSFGAQTKKDVSFEKIFFSGIGMLYSGTGEILSGFFNRPAQEINISRDKKVTMDYSIARVWNPALMDGALALALRDGRKGRGFNLRKGEFELKKSYLGPINEIKRAIILLILLFVSLLFNLGNDYYFLNKRYRAGEQKINELFRQTFPEVKNVQSPVLQMTQKINDLKDSSSLLPGGVNRNQKVLDILKDISQRIPDSLDIDVSNMVIDAETVRITGDTDTYSAGDDLKKNLEQSSYFKNVTLGTQSLDKTGKRVNFDIKMQRAE